MREVARWFAEAVSIVEGCGEPEAELLLQRGITSLEDLAGCQSELLASLPGIDEAGAQAIKRRAGELAAGNAARAARAEAEAAAAEAAAAEARASEAAAAQARASEAAAAQARASEAAEKEAEGPVPADPPAPDAERR
jgi:hypothetical protein